MNTEPPPLGAVYDAGGAMALYWPDTHPCHDTPEHPPWLILHVDGGTEWAQELSQGRLVGYLPGFAPAPSPVDGDLRERLRAKLWHIWQNPSFKPARYSEEWADGAMEVIQPVLDSLAAEIAGLRQRKQADLDELKRRLGMADKTLTAHCKRRDERDAEIKRLRGELDEAYRRLYDALAGNEGRDADINDREEEIERLAAELARERAVYADKPEDRLWHAADQTWWRRAEDGRLVRGDAPPDVGAAIPADAEERFFDAIVDINAQHHHPSAVLYAQACAKLVRSWVAPVSGSDTAPARLDCGCGHPETPFGDDTEWMCDRHRAGSSGGDTDAAPEGGDDA